jgi:ribosomal-protein-alanine N-acetyltransferase
MSSPSADPVQHPSPHTIDTERLRLISLDEAVLTAFVNEETARAASILDVTIDTDCAVGTALAKMRLGQLQADPSLAPWLVRGTVRRSDNRLIGHAGFHSAPDPDYLRELAPRAVEIGYSVCAPFQRNGYAFEAATGLMRWATDEHGVTDFVASISPNNAASLALLRKLESVYRVEQIGRHIDPDDGPEDIYVLRPSSA